jgi:hypothetical protein
VHGTTSSSIVPLRAYSQPACRREQPDLLGRDGTAGPGPMTPGTPLVPFARKAVQTTASAENES